MERPIYTGSGWCVVHRSERTTPDDGRSAAICTPPEGAILFATLLPSSTAFQIPKTLGLKGFLVQAQVGRHVT